MTDYHPPPACAPTRHLLPCRSLSLPSKTLLAPIDYIAEEEVVELVSGHAFSMALTAGGRLYAWGRNDQGQLGMGGTMSMDVYSMAVRLLELSC